MRVGLLHNTLNAMGGAERFCLDLIKVLKENDHVVTVATFDHTNWNRVQENFGEVVEPDKSISVLPFRLPIFGVYQRLLMIPAVNRLREQSDLTINTHSDHLWCNTDITYIHGASPHMGLSLKMKGYQKWKWVYMLPYRLFTWYKLRWGHPSEKIYVSNSYYTAKDLYRLHGVESYSVVYPPVHTEKHRHLAGNGDREDLVLTVARFSRDKELQDLPDIIAKTRDDIRFVLMGYANNRFDREVEEDLRRRRLELGLEGRFEIVQSDQEEKMRLLGRAKVFLSTSRQETFSISSAEAVSSGLSLVVVNEGGHLEIAGCLADILIYRCVGEAARLIEEAVDCWNVDTALENSERVERFSYKHFGEEMMSLIGGLKVEERVS